MTITDTPPFPAVVPFDDHNRTLLEHTHPEDWQNPTPSGRYNMVVLGGGTAGLVTAAGAAGLGAKVALIERELLGGDCLNVGCVPSKALIRAARARYDVTDAERFGVTIDGTVATDFGAVMARMRKLRAGISHHDSAARFRDLGIDVYLGDAEFTGPDTVRVGDQTLNFARACIATGARAVALPIDGLAEAGALTNETVFSLTELPPRLAVLGAGPIGCELAQAFARFGSEVSLIEMAEQILIREDRDAAERIEKSLLRDGIRMVLAAHTQRVTVDGGTKTLHLATNGGTTTLEVDEIVVGVGRAANVEGMGLEAAGVAYDRTGITVDDGLRTSNRKIFAAGDVCSQFKFTHAADAMARIVIGNALFFGRGKASALTIPWCTYTDPEVAHVGLYPEQAAAQGIEIDTHTIEMANVDRAILDGEDEGFLKVHCRRGKDQIVGATIVARHAGDMISEITLAMVHGIGLKGISSVIHPYPTQAEVIKKAADGFNRTRLTPGVLKLFTRIMAWRR